MSNHPVKVGRNVLDHFLFLVFCLHHLRRAVGAGAESGSLRLLGFVKGVLSIMDDLSDQPAVGVPEPVAILQVYGVPSHEDDAVQADLILRLLVVLDEGGEEQVEQAEHDKENHECEENVGEDNGD